MTRLSSLLFTLFLIAPGAAHAAAHANEQGIVSIKSAHDAATTIDRLAAAVEGAGATVFARIDHAAGAEKAGMALRPTILLIFGNPQIGTPALQAGQSIGMDLPLRVVRGRMMRARRIFPTPTRRRWRRGMGFRRTIRAS